MAYSPEKLQLIANLINTGQKINAIAIVTNSSADYISTLKNDPESKLSKLLTIGDEVKSLDFAKCSTMSIAMTSENDSTKLAANRDILSWGDTDGSSSRKSLTLLVEESIDNVLSRND